MNESGIDPCEFKVLVLPDTVDEKTSAGLFLPQHVRDKEQLAQVKATLVATGGNAFDDWHDPIPMIGDRVFVAKYAGYQVEGVDKKRYQVCNDKDIVGILRQE